jgi:uncharacterized protein YdiU (UPF0061 family)
MRRRHLQGTLTPRTARAQVAGAFYSYVAPTAAQGEPTLVAASADVAALLGLDVAEFDSADCVRVFAGQASLPGTKPWAQCYGGHQFGSWAGASRAALHAHAAPVARASNRGSLQASSATGAPSPCSRWSTRRASGTSCSSRAPA